MYKLYRKPNGQIEQVPINDNENVFDDLENLDPFEAKGSDLVKPQFLVQEEKQFDLIKENETQQAKFQSKQLNQSNLQVLNFNVSDFSAQTSSAKVSENYNQTVTTGNVTNCVMFAESLTNDKAIYYNILDIKCNLQYGANANLLAESYVEFYLLENIASGTTSLGRKIARKQNVRGTSSGTITWGTANAQQNYQYITTNISKDTNNVTTMIGNGYRTSGLALKRIDINTAQAENPSAMELNFLVTVDINSAGTVY